MSSIWKYKYFIDVVENKSFTKAGTINYVSQTAISQNISSLEKSIGGKAFKPWKRRNHTDRDWGSCVQARKRDSVSGTADDPGSGAY